MKLATDMKMVISYSAFAGKLILNSCVCTMSCKLLIIAQSSLSSPPRSTFKTKLVHRVAADNVKMVSLTASVAAAIILVCYLGRVAFNCLES